MRGVRRGFILVQTLIVIAALVALMAMIAANQRVSLQETQDRMRQRRAEVAMRSGLARALAALQNADTNLLTLNDDWATLGDGGYERFDLGNAAFRVQILDAGSRVNLNLAPEDQLLQLPVDPEMADSLLDWREESFQARPGGAKDDYYNSLKEPYNARLGRLNSIEELLLIKGWTAERLYVPRTDIVSSVARQQNAQGEPLPLIEMVTVDSGAPNTQADGSARINFGQAGINPQAIAQLGINPAVALQIAASGPYASFQELLNQPGLTPEAQQILLNAAGFTNGTRVEGKINLNTAPEEVLLTIPGMTPDIASAIVARQSTGFTSLGELATVPGAAGPTLGQIADWLTIGGDTWIVRVYGESGGIGTAAEAVVRMEEGRVRIVTWQRLNVTGVPGWWNWGEPTATLDAGAQR